jgi:hypothetical protein
MATQFYRSVNFRGDSLALIALMNDIIVEYTNAGYRLTVRQLYYQLVARGHIENTERSYKRVTGLVNDARIAGVMDWDAIEDRTREFIRRSRWASGGEILGAVAKQFHMDMWEGQKHRVFVIVEKEALAGVLEGVCKEFDVPLLAARGYPSGTVLREFALSDIQPCLQARQKPVILHLGDHDPSGIDMTRDLEERLALFGRTGNIELQRIALNMRQIEEEQPPPNPAKTTDSRFESYRQSYGDESWELDALKPEYLTGLVRDFTEECINTKVWKARKSEIADVKTRLLEMAEGFDE